MTEQETIDQWRFTIYLYFKLQAEAKEQKITESGFNYFDKNGKFRSVTTQCFLKNSSGWIELNHLGNSQDDLYAVIWPESNEVKDNLMVCDTKVLKSFIKDNVKNLNIVTKGNAKYCKLPSGKADEYSLVLTRI